VLRWWFGVTVFLLLVSFFSFLCANEEEPVLGNKEILLDRLTQCSLKSNLHLNSVNVVKPSHSTSVGMGVDKENKNWTRELCEKLFSVPCMTQPYHPGPWEVRMYKSGEWHRNAVAWRVPCEPPECNEPYPFLTRFDWQSQVEDCISNVLPFSDFLAVDLRTDGSDVLVLEINGSFGMPYHWAAINDSTYSLILDHAQWIIDRIKSGTRKLSLVRILDLIVLAVERQLMYRGETKIWF